MKGNKFEDLTSGRLLARNVLFNLLGQGLPLAAALFAIPVLMEGIGTARYGVMSLAWMVIGYFGLFDLGLGRALTQLVAGKLAAHEDGNVPPLVWTALSLMTLLGLLGAAALMAVAPWLVHGVLKIPPELQRETLVSFYLLGLSIPLVINTSGLNGILSAHQRFGLVNSIRVPMGIFSFLGPLMVLPFSNSLTAIVAVLLASRLITWLVSLAACLHVMPSLRRGISLQRAAVRPLLSFGSWMTVSNIVSPLLVYIDRFLIGASLSVTAVAYYSTSYDVTTKLLMIPGAMTGVLFPAFSSSFVQDKGRTAHLFGRSLKYIMLAMFPVTLAIVALAHEGLLLWLGPEFALHGARVLQYLAIGVLVNSLAYIPSTLMQGIGRPDLTAKLHLLELSVYIPSLWYAIKAAGIEGAALVWLGRVALDGALLFFLVHRLLPEARGVQRRIVPAMAAAFVPLALVIALDGTAVKWAFTSLAMAAFLFCAWFLALDGDEKRLAQKYLRLVYAFGNYRK